MATVNGCFNFIANVTVDIYELSGEQHKELMHELTKVLLKYTDFEDIEIL